jgi:hypothetical protein
VTQKTQQRAVGIRRGHTRHDLDYDEVDEIDEASGDEQLALSCCVCASAGAGPTASFGACEDS